MAAHDRVFPVDWSPDAIIVTAHDGAIVHANPRAEDLFGYASRELIDRPLGLLFPSRDGAGGLAAEARRAPLQQSSRLVACAHRDGTRFEALIKWRPAPEKAGAYLVFSLREVEAAAAPPPRTERVELLPLFVHDVRQSLQSIQFICDSIGESEPEAARTIGEIVSSLGRLLDRMSRMEEPGGAETVHERCRVGDLLQTLGRELEPLAVRKGVDLIVDDVSAEITTDPVLFREMLHNLVVNAIRYTDEGSVEVRCRAGSRQVRIEVRDTGVGMDPEEVEAVLGRPDASALPPLGPGLGLLLVRRLAGMLGCRLSVRSRRGKGSCFAVIAPQRAIPRRRPPKPPPGRNEAG
ncbi:MAG TPA: HAMP domain-containing sensor histidine kinase [Gammaproteobacteria bacterium]